MVYIEILYTDLSYLNGIYREIAEIIGKENAILLHKHLKGIQITFPKKLLAAEYVYRQIAVEYDGSNCKDLALKYDYTYSWMQKLVKRLNLNKL